MEKRKKYLGKILVIGVVVLLGGVTVTQTINAGTLSDYSTGKKINEVVAQEVTVEIHTGAGIQEIKKEVSEDDIVKLSLLLNQTQEALVIVHNEKSSEYEKGYADRTITTTLMELNHLGLLPKTVGISEVKKLLTGEYSSNLFPRLWEEKNLFDDKEFPLVLNILCALVSSGGLESITPSSAIWGFFMVIFNSFSIPLLGELSSIFLGIMVLEMLRPRFIMPGSILMTMGKARIDTIGLLGHQSRVLMTHGLHHRILMLDHDNVNTLLCYLLYLKFTFSNEVDYHISTMFNGRHLRYQ